MILREYLGQTHAQSSHQSLHLCFIACLSPMFFTTNHYSAHPLSASTHDDSMSEMAHAARGLTAVSIPTSSINNQCICPLNPRVVIAARVADSLFPVCTHARDLWSCHTSAYGGFVLLGCHGKAVPRHFVGPARHLRSVRRMLRGPNSLTFNASPSLDYFLFARRAGAECGYGITARGSNHYTLRLLGRIATCSEKTCYAHDHCHTYH